MINGIIFDMDGVIVNSMGFHMGIWREVVASYGIEINDKTITEINGMETADTAEYLVQKFALDIHPSVIANKKKGIVMARIHEGIPLFEGAVNALKILKGLGYRIALGTSAPRETMETILSTQLEGFEFDTIVTISEVLKGKPAPDIFLRCAEEIMLKPADCIVIEDSVNGIIAAKAAGMKTVAITTTSSADNFKDADVIIKNIREVNQALIEKLGGK